MELANKLSPELTSLFDAWYEEFIMNMEHEMMETTAWNRLIEHLMNLEKRINENIN